MIAVENYLLKKSDLKIIFSEISFIFLLISTVYSSKYFIKHIAPQDF